MDAPPGSAWTEERQPHHLPAAIGEPSTSGRLSLDGFDDANVPRLRSAARLQRPSRNGTEALPVQPAEDLMAQDDFSGRRDLRARPPSASHRAASAGLTPSSGAGAPGHKARRASVADIFGLGASSRVNSLSRNPDPTLQGSGASTSRSRRASFLTMWGVGAAGGATAEQPGGDDADGAEHAGNDPGTPVRGSKRRRASILSLLRHSHNPAGGEEAGEGVSAGSPPLSKVSLSRKSYRASVMGFFHLGSSTGMRASLTGASGAAEDAASVGSGRRLSRLFSRSEAGASVTSRASRRRSVIDMLGHSSKKVFAKLLHQEYTDDEGEEGDDEDDDGRLWFTSLNDFKPLSFKYLSGRYFSAFFACSVKTGQHYILKRFEKEKMEGEDERGVRRALAFAQMLEHEHIVRCCGTWEDEQALYIVEEYALHGDLLADSMSHPEKYTEAFMATKVVKPLLEVLAYLHNLNIVHRAIFPEHLVFAAEDQLKLGHFTSAVDQRIDPPHERIPFLDYMAPEMLAVRQEDAALGFGVAILSAAEGKSRKALLPHQSRVVRMAGFSNDGSTHTGGRSTGSQLQIPASPPLASAQDGGSGAAGGGGVASLLARSASNFRGAVSLSNGQLSAIDTASAGRSLPASRASSRSPLKLFSKTSRHFPDPLEAPLPPAMAEGADAEIGILRGSAAQFLADGGPAREASLRGGRHHGFSPLKGSAASSRQTSRAQVNLDAPWLLPLDGPRGPAEPPPMLRKRAQVADMDAPWLRPVDADGNIGEHPSALDEPSTAATAGADGGSRHGDPGPSAPADEMDEGAAAASAFGPAADAEAEADAMTVVRPVTVSGTGTAPDATRKSEDAGSAGAPMHTEQAHMHQVHAAGHGEQGSDPRGASGLVAFSTSSGAQHDLAGLHSSSATPSPPPPPLPQWHDAPRRLNSFYSQRQRSDSLPSPALLSPAHSQPPPAMPCRPLSSFHRPAEPGRPGSAAAGRRAATPPPGPEDDDDESLDACLPGSTPILPPNPHAALASRPSSSRTGLEAACLRGQSARLGVSRLASSSRRMSPFASGLQGPGDVAGAAGPVMESLLSDAPDPASSSPPPVGHDVDAALRDTSMKRGVGLRGVSFTTPTTYAATAAAAAMSALTAEALPPSSSSIPGEAPPSPPPPPPREMPPMPSPEDGSGTTPQRMRVASREASIATIGTAPGSSAGQVMVAGLRSLARNFTARLGRSVGRGYDNTSASALEELGTEVAESVGAPTATTTGTAPNSSAQVPSPWPSPADAGPDAMSLFVPTNAWEWQEHYNEKVDLWQVGCLVHEILCMSLPFEAEDKLLACALILWADIVSFPDTLSPECHAFLRACLTKDPAERPSAAELLQHPWIVRHAAGEALKSVRQQREEEGEAAAQSGQELTMLQRAAATVGLGWLLGVPSDASAGGSAASASATAAGSGWGAWVQRWTAKVLPVGITGGGVKGNKSGEAEFERAMQLVQEQQEEERRRSADVEVGAPAFRNIRRSLDAQGGLRRSIELARAGDNAARWQVVL